MKKVISIIMIITLAALLFVGFNNNMAIGNVLADYMDNGGGVVVATFAFYNSGNGLGLGGRISSDGYLPFTQNEQNQETLLQ